MEEQVDKAAQAEEPQYRVEDYFSDGTLLDAIDFIFNKTELDIDEALQRLKNVFLQNLTAAFFTASTLAVFARRTAHNTGYMTMFGIELVGSMFGGDPKNHAEHIEKARVELKKIIEETEWGKKLDEMTELTARGYLHNFIQSNAGRQAVGQIMNQCAVLAWSSFEILASDVFVSLLNRKPTLAAALLNAESTKRYYREKELAVSLAEYNYDLSRHMGEALIQQRRLDDLPAIKNICGILLDKSEALRNVLNETQLWKLYKTRNLIVHRAGVVDALFQKETGDTTPLGTKVRVTPSELKIFMILVGRAGGELIQAATSVIQEKPLSLRSTAAPA